MGFLSFLGIPDFGGGGGSKSSSSGASNYGNQFQYVPSGSYSYQPVQAGATTAGPAYSVTGGPASGTGGILGEVFGRRPGVVGNPDPYSQMTTVLPSLPNLNVGVSEALGRQLSGGRNLDYYRNLASQLGITSGIGAGGPVKSGYLDNSMLIRGLLYEDAMQNQGLQNYRGIIPTISSTQTLSPSLMLENAWWNATNAAAPDPGLRGVHDTIMQMAGMAGGAMI